LFSVLCAEDVIRGCATALDRPSAVSLVCMDGCRGVVVMRRDVQKRAEKRKGGRQTVRATIRFDADVYDDALTVSAKKKVPIGQFVNDVVRKALEDFWRAWKASKAARRATKKQPPPSVAPRSRGLSAPMSKKRAEPPPSVAPRSRVPASKRHAEPLPSVAPSSVPRSRKRAELLAAPAAPSGTLQEVAAAPLSLEIAGSRSSIFEKPLQSR